MATFFRSRSLLTALCLLMLAPVDVDAGVLRPEPARQPVGSRATADATLRRTEAALALLAATAGNGGGNSAVSPYGVAAVLATLDIGADRSFGSAIRRTLRLTRSGPLSIEALRRDGRLLADVAARQQAPLRLATGLFLDTTLTLNPGIDDLVRAEMRADIARVDFSTGAGVESVNHWVSEATRGRIPAILTPGDAPTLVAVNAFSFKADWLKPFDKQATHPAPFHRLDGSVVERPTMVHDNEQLLTATAGRFVAVELPYADQRFAMTLVTTSDGALGPSGFATAVALLAGKGFAVTDTHLELPRFAATGEHDLLNTLSDLGLKSGLASPTQLDGFAPGLKLSALRQKALIEVDETGTEAAAATAALVGRGLVQRPEPKTIRFDRPFVYLLRDRPTGQVLMIGYVAEPAEAP